MPKIKKNNIQTLKQDNWFKKGGKDRFNIIVHSNSVSSFELYIRDDNYYKRVVVPIRGAIYEVDKPIQSFAVASCPPEKRNIHNSLVKIIVEKIKNDIHAANGLIEEFGKDHENNDKIFPINIEEIAEEVKALIGTIY
jgi:hypothetical protein